MQKLEEEARKFMQDNLVIAEVMTADFYEYYYEKELRKVAW